MTNQEFISTVAPLVQKYAKEFGFGVPSAIIAQACLESAYGTSDKAKHNNLFGMKYREGRVSCHSGYFTAESTEEYSVGVYTPITDNWYAFENYDLGVKGYFQFIQNGPYASARSVSQTEHKLYLAALKSCGYATSSSYVSNNESVITKWNLTQYDDLSESTEAKKEESKVSYQYYDLCNAKNISYSGTKRSLSDIKYIVLHYTGCETGTDTAKNNCHFYSTDGSNARAAGAHYFVDASSVYHSISDDRSAWSVGGTRWTDYKQTGGAKLYGVCTNFNSVSVEMCMTNFDISEGTLANAAALTKSLMEKYNVDIDHVVRHFDVTGKSCPGVSGYGYTGGSAKWTAFLNRVSGTVSSTSTATTATTSTTSSGSDWLWKGVVYNCDRLNVRTGAGTTNPAVAAFDHLDPGNTVQVCGYATASDGATWCKVYIEVPKLYGYVHSDYIKPYFTKTFSTKWLWKGKVVGCGDYLNVRLGPGTQYPNVKKSPRLNAGNTVQICDVTTADDGSSWYYAFNETTKCYGFVHSSYVKKV